MWFIMVTYD
ncbi:Protein of unknown function [Lactobacillus acidophilus DSM 20079 = JCM 1132 = NBRC 13951 = CIP 76.13]|nr:Protein of unknown function [Lactobacillus acidophilus DSM 20079 = JCM 1132 = NBRC 13951 = CIP 76.13]CDF68819.1 Protein of unknown function [Lactobacillus acidophilus CIRM-BIA 442]